MPLYKIEPCDQSLRAFRASALGEHYTESKLEDWLEGSPEVLLGDEPLLLIGRQVNTPVGILDLLALDSLGYSVIIELKRSPSQREAGSQGLEYASWISGLDVAGLEEIAGHYFSKRGQKVTLRAAWEEKYGTELKPLKINSGQRVFIVIEGQDSRISSFVKYLRAMGNDISLFGFEFYRSDSGEELLSIRLEVGEAEPAPREAQRPSESFLVDKWPSSLSEAYEGLRDALFEGGLYAQPKKSGISFLVQTRKWPVFICFFNEASSAASVWLRADSMASIFDFDKATGAIVSSLPLGSAVKHSSVWYMISFPPSKENGEKVAKVILGEVVQGVLANYGSLDERRT
jgi:hypothetical protein